MERRKFNTIVILLAFLVITLHIFNPWSVVLAEKNPNAIKLLGVNDSIESRLSAVAVNGRPIEPTYSPQANIGDVISFQIDVSNRMVFPLFDIKTRLDWGTGLVYEGNMDRENMQGRFDAPGNEISLFIAEIRPRRENVGYACSFDLRVVGCTGLTVDVHPDVIYSRRSVPSHHVAVQMENANIPYATDSRNNAAAGLTSNEGMRPAETRSGSITANPLDKENLLASAGYDDTIALSSRQDNDRANDAGADSSKLVLPEDPDEAGGAIEGDEVFGGCGNIHVFFSMAQIYKSNLYRTKDDKEDVWATYLTPGVWAAIPGSCERIVEIVTASATPGGLVVSPFYPKTNRRYQGYLLYSPQAEIYWGKSDENMVSHRADVYFRYQTLNKFSFRALDQFKYSHDSISSRALTIDDRYKNNLFNVVGTYDPTAKFGLRLDYSNFYLNYDSSENSRADRMDNSVSAYAYFNLSSKTSIFANYEYSNLDYDNIDFDSEEYRYFGGIRWEITDKTAGQLKGGYGKRRYDQSGLEDADSWMAELQIDHNLTSRTHIVLNAYRRYDEPIGEIVNKDDVEGNFTKYILTHFVGLTVNYDLTSKLHLNLDTTVFYDEYEDEGRLSSQKQRKDWEYAISPSVKYDFSNWLILDASYIYTKRDSNYSEYDFDDHTVMLRGSIYQ